MRSVMERIREKREKTKKVERKRILCYAREHETLTLSVTKLSPSISQHFSQFPDPVWRSLYLLEDRSQAIKESGIVR
uniref:Uncharacterized protein n=1 Tax=Vespula pensylvanica TaxID=30213 RepID=A0A834KHQ8_VESPE|nr:hypothetical protein H0235_014589 [Vespula pensylvanica]